MTDGVQRLKRQEAVKEAQAETARKTTAEETALEPVTKKQKTMENITRRARRLTLRLASMANRCFGVSAAELAVRILTGGDRMQSHNDLTIVTSTIQWTILQSARHLNNETVEDEPQHSVRSVQAVSVCVPVKPRASSLLPDG